MKMDAGDAIRQRISVRSYDPRPVPDALLQELSDWANALPSPFAPRMRMKILHTGGAGERRLGTYGVIRGATTYLAAAIREDPQAPEALGYALEGVILRATSMGLSTCWLGGTFDKGAFAKEMDLQPGEVFPIVTPIGYAARRITLTDALMRRGAHARKRLPWDRLFFDGDAQSALDPEQAGLYREPLEMLRLAPSAVNRQPWRVIRKGSAYHFYCARSMPRATGFDLQRLDVGIAICHFDLSTKALELPGAWQVLHPAPADGAWEYVATWIGE